MSDNIIVSKPDAADLVLYQGDTGAFRVSVTDGTNPMDVSGATWRCMIRLSESPTDAIELLVVPVALDTSSVDVYVEADNAALLTGNGVWDLEMDLSGNITTLLAGRVKVQLDVSH
jgi:hypothetical protein